MKHIILANPVSVKKKGKIYATRLKELLKENGINAEIIMCECPKHFTKVAQELSKKINIDFMY